MPPPRKGRREARRLREGEERLDDLADRLDAHPVPLDATKTGEMDRLFGEAVEEFERVSGAANCVGSFMLKPAHLTSDEEWAQTIALNMTTAFGTIKAAAKHMPYGDSVVLLSSVAARVGLANHEAIAASKAGVTGLALSAAATYVGRDLRVNSVAPGLVQTPMTESVTRSETSRQASVDLHPLGRLGEPADVAAMIEWLLDPANTGSLLRTLPACFVVTLAEGDVQEARFKRAAGCDRRSSVNG